jgi:hypothetical protein
MTMYLKTVAGFVPLDGAWPTIDQKHGCFLHLPDEPIGFEQGPALVPRTGRVRRDH